MSLHPIALQYLNIKADYNWRKPYTYENLEWNDAKIAKPTKSELESAYTAAVANAAIATLRQRRNQLLSETDYLALVDSTLTDEMKEYRQALRDLPANTEDPTNPVWPTKPQ